MSGLLLISPTGSGKTSVIKDDRFFIENAIDGDTLIDWSKVGYNVDWHVKDREHLDVVLDKMRSTGTCVCWFVGTTAIADAIDEGRLSSEQVVIVLLPEREHIRNVVIRNKKDHGWDRAIEHRKLCENLVAKYGLKCFSSFREAAEFMRTSLLKGQLECKP